MLTLFHGLPRYRVETEYLGILACWLDQTKYLNISRRGRGNCSEHFFIIFVHFTDESLKKKNYCRMN